MDIIKICQKYQECKNMKQTAEEFGIGPQTVRKILISVGAYDTPTISRISQYPDDVPNSQIAAELKMTEKAVCASRKYIRKQYKINQTDNAKRIQCWREKKKKA